MIHITIDISAINKANTEIKKIMTENQLTDIWRLQKPKSKQFTWGSKHPYKRARLDFFLISEQILCLAPDCNIEQSYRTDHNVISLTFYITKSVKGKGSWKLNNPLLEDDELCTLINK